jgi:UDP-glucuronate 4-epimerase
LIVLVTGAAGFVGSHVSLALKKRGDGLVGVDNFNDYYEVSLKRARQDMLAKHGIFVIDEDINNAALWTTLFDLVQFTHIMHLAAQAGVRYAMQNPGSYVNSNIAGLVTLFEACKSANPQPSIVWASSSSVYGLNSKVCMCCNIHRLMLSAIWSFSCQWLIAWGMVGFPQIRAWSWDI